MPVGSTKRSLGCLSTGEDLEFVHEGDRVIFPALPEVPPDPHISVIALELDGEPRRAE